MSQEAYRRTIERLIGEVWNQQHLDVLDEVFTQDAVMHRGGPEDRGGEEMIGIPAFLAGYLRPTQAAFPDIQHEIKDLLVDSDRVTVRFHGEGTHKEEFMGIKATGKVMRYEGIAIFRMKGPLIAEIWVHSSAAKQIAALQDD
jgi:predicted ester cyclase